MGTTNKKVVKSETYVRTNVPNSKPKRIRHKKKEVIENNTIKTTISGSSLVFFISGLYIMFNYSEIFEYLTPKSMIIFGGLLVINGLFSLVKVEEGEDNEQN